MSKGIIKKDKRSRSEKRRRRKIRRKTKRIR